MQVRNDLVELTAWVVSSFVAHNSVALSEVPKLINSTHNALLALNPAPAAGLTRVPAVPPEKSVTRDYIICLDDGRRLKTLKAHIRRKYSLSPDEYRARWQLPEDYPMVAPAYAELRSAIARREFTAARDAEPAPALDERSRKKRRNTATE
jgi:predicted transcriptional regulator